MSKMIDSENYLTSRGESKVRSDFAAQCADELLEGQLGNFLWNFNTVRRYPGILGFRDIFKGYPSVMVGAGPSLDKNAHLLEPNKDKMIIIALDAALPTLVHKLGIYPDIVTMVDPTEKQKENFEGVDTEKFVTIAPTTVHPSIFRIVHPKHMAVYNSKDDKSLLLEMIPYHTGKKGAMPSGVLSSGAAFTFSGILGCRPMTFIGHDLCWESFDKVYADGVSEKKSNFQKAAKFRGNCLLFPDINGNMVVTHQTFAVFYLWLRDSIAITSVQCYNSSEAGILKMKRIKVLPFQKYINKFCKKVLINKQEKIQKALDHEYQDGFIEKIMLPPISKEHQARMRYVTGPTK